MEEWKGKFFQNDAEEAPVDYEPDHVITVSELTGNRTKVLETVESTKSTALSLKEREAEDYRQLLAEIRRPYQPPEEKRLSRGIKTLLILLALAASIAGGLFFSFGVFTFMHQDFRFPAFLPQACSMALFLMFSFFYFCTKGKTEKLLMILLLISGALTLLSVFLPRI